MDELAPTRDDRKPIVLETKGPHLFSTLHMRPSPASLAAYHAMIRKELERKRQQRPSD